MGKVYLVRHGRTAWNRGEVFRGTSEVPLDDIGREQARLVGCALRAQTTDPMTIVCSPLARAAETADIVARQYGEISASGPRGSLQREMVARPDPGLTDINVGEWTGMPLTQVEERYPGQYDLWVRSPGSIRFPGGQTLQEVQDLSWSRIQSLVPLARTGDVIVVSHRLTLKTIILKAVGASLQDFWSIRLDTASISILEALQYGAKERLTLSRLNDVSHLARLGVPDRIDF